MPATGTLDTAFVGKGPGMVYLAAPVPLDGQVVALTLNPTSGFKEPDSGQKLGLTPEGNTISIGYEQTAVEADEVTGPIYQVIDTETLSIAGAAYQTESIDMLKHMTPTGTPSPGAGTALQLTFGGRADLTPDGQKSVLLVWNLRSAPGKAMWFQLYKAINTDGTSFQVTRKAMTQASYTFTGQSIPTRLAGDQIGILGREAAGAE